MSLSTLTAAPPKSSYPPRASQLLSPQDNTPLGMEPKWAGLSFGWCGERGRGDLLGTPVLGGHRERWSWGGQVLVSPHNTLVMPQHKQRQEEHQVWCLLSPNCPRQGAAAPGMAMGLPAPKGGAEPPTSLVWVTTLSRGGWHRMVSVPRPGAATGGCDITHTLRSRYSHPTFPLLTPHLPITLQVLPEVL